MDGWDRPFAPFCPHQTPWEGKYRYMLKEGLLFYLHEELQNL
mgnify:CR=1 FL=1